nr:uncharacterized protein LOC109163772 [Ipomoea batatas]
MTEKKPPTPTGLADATRHHELVGKTEEEETLPPPGECPTLLVERGRVTGKPAPPRCSATDEGCCAAGRKKVRDMGAIADREEERRMSLAEPRHRRRRKLVFRTRPSEAVGSWDITIYKVECPYPIVRKHQDQPSTSNKNSRSAYGETISKSSHNHSKGDKRRKVHVTKESTEKVTNEALS